MVFKIRVFLSIFLLIFPLLLVAKEVGIKSDRDIKKVIISYNQGIIKAARTSKSEHMREFAKDEIVDKFHLWIKSWHDSNLFMDASMVDIVFKPVNYFDDRAEVVTDEEWIYKYIDIKLKKEVQKLTNIKYSIKYTLSKDDSRWIISKIDVVSEEKRQN